MNSATKLISRGLLIISLGLGVSASAQNAPTQCHWWQFRCDADKQIEGLPADAPRTGTVVTIDTAANRLYLFKDGQLVDKSLAATGSEKILKKGSKVWLFRTPQGHLKVLRKIEDPVWTKPDLSLIHI